VVTYRDGGVHLFDEIDAADPNLMVLINAALANGHLSIPFEDMIVHRHADTAIIAAANTFGTGASRQYVGRNALDAATLDRFAVSTVYVDYDRALEEKLTAGFDQWRERCWDLRDKIVQAGLRRIMSTRTLVNGRKRLAAGDSIDSIEQDYFSGWSADERARV
jgi:MoxR-like ATPase